MSITTSRAATLVISSGSKQKHKNLFKFATVKGTFSTPVKMRDLNSFRQDVHHAFCKDKKKKEDTEQLQKGVVEDKETKQKYTKGSRFHL